MSDQKIPGNQNVVMLPCTADQFSDFIGDLLGKPQVITRSFEGALDIRFSDIEALYHLIDHRLSEQNLAKLLQFSATFSYSDQSTVMINSFAEFRRYAEVKDVETEVLTCSFEYLIQFQGRTHPERQIIDVSFSRQGASFSDDVAGIRIIGPRTLTLRSAVFLRIKHTARSWGADIESLLSSHLTGLIQSDSGWRTWMRRHSGKIGLLFAGLSVASGFAILTSVLRYLNADRVAAATEVLSKIHNTNSSLQIGIPLLIRQNMESWTPWNDISVLVVFVATLVVAIAVAAGVDSSLDVAPPSFLTFTKADERRKPKVLAQYQKSIWYSVGAALGAILYGVVGNYLFEALKTWLH
jgi:hypothetical protein